MNQKWNREASKKAAKKRKARKGRSAAGTKGGADEVEVEEGDGKDASVREDGAKADVKETI